jgi:ABC-2 type transport system permease protein
MFRYAFRLHRWGIIGFGLTLTLSTITQASAFVAVAGTTPASRAQFAQSMTALAAQLTYLLPPPSRLDTLAGYVLWRSWGTLPILTAFWAVAAATGAARGDEEKHLVDIWLASRVSRVRLLVTRSVAFATAALVAAALAGLGTILGAAGAEPIGVDRAAGQALALWLVTVAMFALAYLLAQLAGSTRGAQGLGAGVMAVLYFLNAAARSLHSLDGIAWLSPFHWYEKTNVLVQGGHLDEEGVTLSLATIAVATFLAALAFSRRDIGAALFSRPAPRRAARDILPSPALSWPVARLLYRQRWMLILGTLGVAAMAVFMVSLARSVVDSFANLPTMRSFLTQGGADPYRGYIGVFWFGIAQLLLAGFAIQLVAGWAAEDNEGLLEAMLSRPRPRWSVVIERAATAAVAIALLAAVGSLAAAVTAAASGTSLDAGGVFRATWPLIPFGLTFAAAGAVGTAWWPRAAVGALGLLAFLSYLLADLAPLFNWPGWIANLSVFKLYGAPLTAGVFWPGVWTMVAITLAGFGLGVVLMQRREIAG